LSASQFVQTLEKRQGLKIACLEEIALNKGYLSPAEFKNFAKSYPQSEYGKYARDLVELA
jgi:glucose-1-phosphate thymidylyltransferase